MVILFMKRVELLAPAKNFKALKAALPYADSIYFGVEKFNMRMRTENFKETELKEIVRICHAANVKAYLATNIIIYDNELVALRVLVEQAHKAEIDALIIHDLALIPLCKEFELKFHISTQQSVSNIEAANFFSQLGAKRIVLARELSLEQIKYIRNHTSIVIECFIHGAQCTSISGRCYFSRDICGSDEYSANRGKCIQPCRRTWRVIDEEKNEFIYDGQYFLNAKDLCMIQYIPQLIEANMDAFKIEGRMRSPVYVEIVTKCYKEAISAYYDNDFTQSKVDQWLTELKKVYNRGFSTGFYFGRPTEVDIEQTTSGNISEYRKVEIGYVQAYFRNLQVAKIVLVKERIRLGDELFILGRGSDTYLHQTIKSIQVHGKDVSETPLADNSTVLATIQIDNAVKKNDRLYKLAKIT
jgi:putative protease